MPTDPVDSKPHSDQTDPICEFYNSHPYPPPIDNLDRARDEWRDGTRERAEYHLFWPGKPYRDNLKILIAGCGTWQAAKYALCRPNANVVGIDVSSTSLDHTEQLKRKYNLTNLETRQLAIENVAKLAQRFDLVVCTGVLHHLADPDAGLRALRSVLTSEGAIYLMVYAPHGRHGIYLMQEYCRRLGIRIDGHEITDLLTVVKSLSPHHPLSVVFRSARDTANADALADALLNPRDRPYSVRQLFEFIDSNDLVFGRWYWQAPYLPQCGSVASTPHAKRLLILTEQKQYGMMELFRGTMTTHSMITYCKGNRPEVRFDDESFSRYVPIRLPHTLCVVERLPHGAAGVLLNQSHPFSDLILVIDAREKKMFDAIDGQRSSAQIVERAGAELSQARTFFERLWRYDQVVFDASK